VSNLSSEENLSPKLESSEIATLMAQGQHSLARLMLQINRQFSAIAAQRYAARGYAGLTPVHVFFMANLDLDGTRIVTAADRMKTTKQFAGRLVQELESRHYVETTPDPTDRRATLVKVTDAGWQFFKDACEVKNEIEAEYQALIGEEQMGMLESVLETLATYNPQNADSGHFPGAEVEA